ncbi:GEL complex subunit OPTI-like [Antedon mediterranea]|uniref:GEL complex subunit OPTI-like n=1 Tax=Antedon mediterranea TaxID=105859 RepID=UPI003AF984B7
MATQRRKPESKSSKTEPELPSVPSVWKRAFTSGSEWPDKDELLDVIYWGRQIVGIIFGLIWGAVQMKGIVGLALFCAINAGILYVYFMGFQKIDDEEFGGVWELTKEGFMTSFALFLIVWIIVYSAIYFE